ncbi:MAG: WD40/YVTN/BNR-like repeat-containing protein [Gaiellaceae bacterium]
MASVMLLVGTRKGLFVLTSDEARRDWQLRGPFCEGWPVFHAIFDPARETIFAAAASDWHGTTVWRSADLGETWAQSGEGLTYGEDGPKLSKASSLSLVNGSLFAGVDQPGLFESRDGGLTWSYFSGLEDQAARETWMQPNASPPGNLGIIALIPHPDDPSELLANVQGYGVFRSEDGGSSWAPWNSGFRADWPQQDPAWGYCIHKIVTTSADTQRLFAQSHCGMFRSSDRGANWEEITQGLPGDFGFAAAAHPHDRDSDYFIPVDPGHARCTPGKLVVWRTEDAGDSWRPLTRGLPQEDAYLGILREGMSNDTLDEPGFYFGTSTGQVFASADEGESWSEIASHLPGIASVEAVVLPA